MKTGPDHRLYRVHYFDSNPTLEGDNQNAALSEGEQFPPPAPKARYIYDGQEPVETAADSTAYEHASHPQPVVLRCSRVNYPEVEDAQRYFDAKRVELRWKYERPIYRTARFWTKQVYY